MVDRRETLDEQLAAARERVTELESELTAAREVEARQRQSARRLELDETWAAILEADDSEFYATAPSFDVRPYILPFGREHSRWDPRDMGGHPFGRDWLAGGMGLICKRTDVPRTAPSRIIHSSGLQLSEHDKIGQRFEARHDQTGAKLGVYEIVGLVFYSPDGSTCRTVGDVPDRKLSLNTYK